MRRAVGLLVATACAVALGAARAGQDEAQTPRLRAGSTPAAAYVARALRGFDVRIDPALVAGGAAEELGARAIDALERDLAFVAERVPAAALPHLREVPIFLSRADPVTLCACYHPSALWLEAHRFDPAKARAVEITNAELFLDFRREQPSLVLHELSHALHDRVLGAATPRIEAALAAVVERGVYDDVLRASGARDRHYALTNAQEYFAETSEAYFAINDFAPFVRAELELVDPDGARLIAELWALKR